MADSVRAQQREEDYQDELRRLQQDHAEIIRPDKRLWFGVAVLVILTAAGVAWPLFLMSQGPADLARVRYALWPFMAALLILIIYVVVYLATITRRTMPSASAAAGDALAPRQAEPGEVGPDWTSQLFVLIWPH